VFLFYLNDAFCLFVLFGGQGDEKINKSATGFCKKKSQTHEPQHLVWTLKTQREKGLWMAGIHRWVIKLLKQTSCESKRRRTHGLSH
jgi:hypothetical protein